MLSETETLFDYSEGMRLEKEGDFAAAAEAYWKCWANFQSADLVQDTDLQRETADDARDDAIRIAQAHFSEVERRRFEEEKGFNDYV